MVESHPLLEQFEDPTTVEQMSFDQFMEDTVEPDLRTLVEDEPRQPLVPVTGRHQDVRLYVTVLLKSYVEMVDAGRVLGGFMNS